MKRIIACCGIDCATCDARIATITNDNELRTKTAESWKVMFDAPDISPEMINCTGCREEGAKFSHCEQCDIRKCVRSKNYLSCADCSEMESCSILMNVAQYVPDAMMNLKSLM